MDGVTPTMNLPFDVEGARKTLIHISEEKIAGIGLANIAQVSCAA